MILIDTSLWIDVFRDKIGQKKQRLQDWIGEQEVVLTRFNQLELLQGCKNEQEWDLLSHFLEKQIYLEASTDTWQSAARIYYDLRRQGLTVRSPVDCCIAQIALENNVLLAHNDRDFESIAKVCALQHYRFSMQ
jgi:predicted nucleic acid-binding protein